jgi:hypothetical protein
MSFDQPFYMKEAIDVPQLQMHSGRPRKLDPLEALNRHLVVHQHDLAAAGKEPTDIDLVRTRHHDS